MNTGTVIILNIVLFVQADQHGPSQWAPHSARQVSRSSGHKELAAPKLSMFAFHGVRRIFFGWGGDFLRKKSALSVLKFAPGCGWVNSFSENFVLFLPFSSYVSFSGDSARVSHGV